MTTKKASSSHVKSKARGAYHHGDLKRTLLDAALALALERGPAGFTLAEICRAAGVSQAAPYRHYESKEHLLAEASAEGFRLLMKQEEVAFAGCDDLETALRRVTAGYLSFARQYPAHLAVMFTNRMGDYFQGAARKAEAAGPEGLHALPPPANRTEEAILECWRVGQSSFLELVNGFVRLAPGSGLERTLAADGGRGFASACWAMLHGVAVLVLERMIEPEWADNDGERVFERMVRPWLQGQRALEKAA
jgi:AcrR family transcriptional regulator